MLAGMTWISVLVTTRDHVQLRQCRPRLTQTEIDYEKALREIAKVLVPINKQSPDIEDGLQIGKDDLDFCTSVQKIMFGYVNDETEDCMPLTCSMATRLIKKLTDASKSNLL